MAGCALLLSVNSRATNFKNADALRVGNIRAQSTCELGNRILEVLDAMVEVFKSMGEPVLSPW